MNYIRTRLKRIAVLAAVVLSGCVSNPLKEKESFRPTPPTAPAVVKVSNGAIYQSDSAISLFEDRKAARVGDIIIIVLNESTNASKKASTAATKENSTSSTINTIAGLPVTAASRLNRLNNAYSSSNDFAGKGDSSQSNEINGTVAVTVESVLANGNLQIRGEKRLRLNQGEEFVQIAGIIRQSDISASNTILSTQVADARIIYSGKGMIADSNSMGWLTRFFNSKYWPL